MRIGILTVPFNNNYGGYLQAYALMQVLKRMGHEPTIIMRRHQKKDVSKWYKIKYFIRRLLKSVVKLKWYTPFFDIENVYYERGANLLPFVEKYIYPQTKFVYDNPSLIKECQDRFDAYIVGSDQVWRSIYVPGIVQNYFLDFTKKWDVVRISYAASFGTDTPEYTNIEKKLCGKLLESFDAVSVREESAIKVFKEFKWNVRNSQMVIDPTLLLSIDDYNIILPSKNVNACGKIFCYVLDKNEETNKTIIKIKKLLNKDVYEIVDIQKGNFVLPSIETWLTAIRDADYVITDSFHGTVFSLIFKKSFIVCVNKERGSSRFENLLSLFNFNNRTNNVINLITNLYISNREWDNFDDCISRLKINSFNFLTKYLKK